MKKPPPLYNVEVWSKENGRYVHTATVRWSVPYTVARSVKERLALEYNQYAKIIKNK